MSGTESVDAPSERLLRTLAAVPVSSTILDLGCGTGRHVEAFLRLGFPVHACDSSDEAVRRTRSRVRELVDDEAAQTCVHQRDLSELDAIEATFDWVIVDRPEAYVASQEDLRALVEKARQQLEPGGWLYLTVPAQPDVEGEGGVGDPGLEEAGFAPSDVSADALDVDLANSRFPERIVEEGEERIHAIYRRVNAQTPA